jgi:hypothetical protein
VFRGITHDGEQDQTDPFGREGRVGLDEAVDAAHEELGRDADEHGDDYEHDLDISMRNGCARDV